MSYRDLRALSNEFHSLAPETLKARLRTSDEYANGTLRVKLSQEQRFNVCTTTFAKQIKVRWGSSMYGLVNIQEDLELYSLFKWQPVQIEKNWGDVFPFGSIC